jgi:uncharacterized membrane protein YkvA (DUF1232 family)
MIKLPLRVSDDLRQRIENSYSEAIRQVGEAEESYVRSKLPKVLTVLARGSQDWRSEVAVTASAIFTAYETSDQVNTAQGDSRYVLLAALFYLCNPYDIIPDRVPSMGFADDAVVLNECLRRIEQEAPEMYREISASMAKSRG